ncbi:hypothetical protein C8J56DRAFT_1004906 [Mycena floridula]|nr:hypothetical protein C8J56DRAFT_1004906 [Mycena floridula]
MYKGGASTEMRARATAQEDAESGKRKRYMSSDDPMAGWRPMSEEFLANLLWTKGLGYELFHQQCTFCETSGSDACGPALFCQKCGVERHQLLPLHKIQVWNGDFWDCTSLFKMGLVYQLGHSGMCCVAPDSTSIMTMIGATSIQQIWVSWCGCVHSDHSTHVEQLMQNQWYLATVVDPHSCATFEALDSLRVLNVVTNVNVCDFITSLEILTDGVYEPPICLPTTMKCVGRGHETGGIASTAPGEAAILCWACPYEGINLPDNWKEAVPKEKFLYMLFDDPPLDPGMGYQVDEVAYHEYLRGYVSEEDISTCLAFAAIAQKNTRLSTGLRTSGIGGCTCTCHKCMRPLGLRDLQKGEQYANMDYVLFSAIKTCSLQLIFLTYNIACQYMVHLKQHNKSMPEDLQRDFTLTEIRGALPIWHGNVHYLNCRMKNLVQYQEGAAKIDGEGPERVWGQVNKISFATKEMGVGTRHDAIEDRLDHHNHEKNVRLGLTLAQKLHLAIAERDIQIKDFEEVHETLEKPVQDLWSEEYVAWCSDREKNHCLFAPKVKGMSAAIMLPHCVDHSVEGITEAEVRLQLKKEEATEAAASKATQHGTSTSSFMTLGLEIEESQQRLQADMKSILGMTTSEMTKVEGWQLRIHNKLKCFRTLQEVFMSAAFHALTAEDDAQDSDIVAPRAEDVKLWLPSELPNSMRSRGCAKGLVEMEIQLQVVQCSDALKQYSEKYRAARMALIGLKGIEACNEVRELRDADVQLEEVLEKDAIVTRKLGLIGSSQTRVHQVQLWEKSGKKKKSWIWTVGAFDGDEEADEHELRLNDSVRVEWSKARARKERWTEEVSLLQEEMKQVRRFFTQMASGLCAYALKQAQFAAGTRARFEDMWRA